MANRSAQFDRIDPDPERTLALPRAPHCSGLLHSTDQVGAFGQWSPQYQALQVGSDSSPAAGRRMTRSAGPRDCAVTGACTSDTNSPSASAEPSIVINLTAGGNRAAARSASSRAAKPPGSTRTRACSARPELSPTAMTEPPSAPLLTSATTLSQRRNASSAARRSWRSSNNGVSSSTAPA